MCKVGVVKLESSCAAIVSAQQYIYNSEVNLPAFVRTKMIVTVVIYYFSFTISVANLLLL